MTSFIALFDLHFGWERKAEKGKMITRPTHNLRAVNAVLEFAKDFKPDVVILGGDQLDAGPVSHWRRGKPRLTEKFRLKEEMELLDKHVLEPIDRLKPNEKVWISGNHERFIADFLTENPGIEGMIEPQNYLHLFDRGWLFVDEGELFKLGKLNFVHGEQVRGANPAKKLVSSYRRNIRCGHHHTFDVSTDVTPYDRSDYHTGIVVPAMSAVNPSYMKNRSSNFQQGFLAGWVNKDGSFSDYVVIVNRGKFVWNGKVYGNGKSK